MNESNRAELIETLATLAKKYPQWRFGQLVANVAGWTDLDVWDIEDHQLLAAAKLHLAEVAEAALAKK